MLRFHCTLCNNVVIIHGQQLLTNNEISFNAHCDYEADAQLKQFSNSHNNQGTSSHQYSEEYSSILQNEKNSNEQYIYLPSIRYRDLHDSDNESQTHMSSYSNESVNGEKKHDLSFCHTTHMRRSHSLPLLTERNKESIVTNNSDICLPTFDSSYKKMLPSSMSLKKSTMSLTAIQTILFPLTSQQDQLDLLTKESVNSCNPFLKTELSSFPLCALYCSSCLGLLETETNDMIQSIEDEILLYEQHIQEMEANISSSEIINKKLKENKNNLYEHHMIHLRTSRQYSYKNKKKKFTCTKPPLLPKHIRLLKQRLKRFKDKNQLLKDSIQQSDVTYIQQQSALLKDNSRLAALEASVHYKSALLTQMDRFNVMNDAFHIWAEGPYGTINGLKLGKIPNDNVTWEEVNAAWGQAAFLLDSLIQFTLDIYYRRRPGLAEKLTHIDTHSEITANNSATRLGIQLNLSNIAKEGLKPPQLDYMLSYRILPRGSHSAVLRRSDGSIFELYGNGGSITRFFATRRFDSAMVIILGLTKDLILLATYIRSSVSSTTELLKPPFEYHDVCALSLYAVRIGADTVGFALIRLPGATGGEVWRKCLKNLLINLKWLIGVVEGLQALSLSL